MSRVSVVMYECDWCKAKLPARYPNGHHNDDELPEGWKELDYSTMCTTCLKARKDAIDLTRHARLNQHTPEALAVAFGVALDGLFAARRTEQASEVRDETAKDKP